MKQKLLVLAAMSTLLLSACSKKTATPNNPNPTSTKPPKELMVGSWGYVSVTSDDPDNPNPLDTCGFDDLFIYKADGTWSYDDGTNLCEPGLPPVTGTCNVDNYPALEINSPQMVYKQENKIIQLDASILKFERKYPQVNSHTMTFIMKRK